MKLSVKGGADGFGGGRGEGRGVGRGEGLTDRGELILLLITGLLS